MKYVSYFSDTSRSGMMKINIQLKLQTSNYCLKIIIPIFFKYTGFQNTGTQYKKLLKIVTFSYS